MFMGGNIMAVKIPQLKSRLGKSFLFKNKTAEKAEILLYGAIGISWFEDFITAKEFSEQLNALGNPKEIDVRINSPGGDCFEGITICNRLLQHPAKITVYVDGMAASIASVIMLAGEKIVMGEGAQVMVHKSWCYAAGNSIDMDNTSDRLNTLDDQMIAMYHKKSGKSKAEIRDLLMKGDTWMTADEALEFGLVDEKFEETMPIAASILDMATWLGKVPKAVLTKDAAVKADITNTLKNIEAFNKKV